MNKNFIVLNLISALGLGSFSAGAAEVAYQFQNTMNIRSTAIQGNLEDACRSKGKDTEALIRQVEAANPELQGLISQKSDVGLADGSVDCLYHRGVVGVFCGSYHTNYACFTDVALAGRNQKLVFHRGVTGIDAQAQLSSAKNVVYSEIDAGNVTWVSVETK